jgi:hypothetical protein
LAAAANTVVHRQVQLPLTAEIRPQALQGAPSDRERLPQAQAGSRYPTRYDKTARSFLDAIYRADNIVWLA